ncbi:CobW family GTP-binding protein [Variovorax ginsengisoli]|uniref:G3E family GTPase n=1 Tax=Variovorax ginsengisoli TaxID=363844 RepID=A0ABT9S7H0_9BURK|nr:GTP-binding protein [Variovorax ginsengisoli]MDP9900312.1 G3E family GTPase [Variovorax ginsengisoli]
MSPHEAHAHSHGGRIPLTVIGGFLGTGKTTLLNRLLENNDGRRLAVLVNDFGAINVDAALVASRGVDTMSLQNGCVCCQIGGDLTDALIRVIGSVPRPDAIVIEASGVSDPWRIAQVGLADPALALDGVVVLVDVASVREQADDPLLADTVRRQLQAADLLVLNQCDRVDDASLAALRVWLDAEVPGTPRHETRFAEVPAALLGAPLASSGHGNRCAPGCTHDHDHAPHHGDVFATWSVTDDAIYRADALRDLLRAMPAGVLRLKGVVRTDRLGWAVLQFAGRHGSLRAWSPQDAAPDANADSALVAIGAHGRLAAQALEAALKAAHSIPPSPAAPRRHESPA